VKWKRVIPESGSMMGGAKRGPTKMKIQLASDLHLEFIQSTFPGERLIVPAAGADALVLAGDIAIGTQAISLFANWPVPVLYLAGNHEFYSQAFDEMRVELREAAKGTSIRFMDNDVVELEGVRFLGTTLWTDYKLYSEMAPSTVMAYADRELNDHHEIRVGNNGRFTPEKALQEHEQSRNWLGRQLAIPYEGKTVVVTHHGPHPLSVHPRYVDDYLSAAFVSDLSDFLAEADFWLHGHVHDSFDYATCGSRVVANPRGYPMNVNHARKVGDLKFENPDFQETLLIDLQ